MPQLVSFEPAMERLARFVEETPPASVVRESLALLRAGEDPMRLAAAAGLAVSRSTEVGAYHHGGPVHPVSGLHAVFGLTARAPKALRPAPSVQAVALANQHIHSPSMGPAAMCVLQPMPGKDTASLVKSFAYALRNHEAVDAERCLLALLERTGPGPAIETALRAAIRRNQLDDHYFLYLVYAIRALDGMGWQWAPVLLRPVVRYLARHPLMEPVGEFDPRVIEDGVRLYRGYDEFLATLPARGIVADRLRIETAADETATIAALANRIATVASIVDVQDLLIEALAAGLSLSGTAEALSAGGARLFLRSRSGNPFDVHIHTGVNARRYLIGRADLPVDVKLQALLNWNRGTEVRYLDPTLAWTPGPDPTILAALPRRDGPAILAAIEECALTQPALDINSVMVSFDKLVAPDGARQAIALAAQYVTGGYDPAPFFALMTSLICRDDQSEMHGYKMQQAAFEEYYATREPLRGPHLMAAARHVTTVATMLPKTVWPAVSGALAA
jgi:hypothetical protein